VLFRSIERHLYAFYDLPELMHRMNEDLTEYHLRILKKMAGICRPTFMTFAEDMSYNHGPMLSKELFQEFLAPYYRRVVPVLEEMNIIPIVDTDGDVTSMVPWLQAVGIRGILPLERQAGVDAAVLRKSFPRLNMIGHYDKMVMNKGEAAIRQEFERLLPTMKTGGFIPGVDHQTPPGVSLAQYRVYLRLLREYTQF
jgi:uroporphyrinogen-III decarboxylase